MAASTVVGHALSVAPNYKNHMSFHGIADGVPRWERALLSACVQKSRVDMLFEGSRVRRIGSCLC